VGTWHRRKRGQQLAAAFVRDVLPLVPDAELRMVTSDAPDDLPTGITPLGRISDEELAQEYERAWVFCLPSSYEGFGIPYAEAMTAGLPVVATPNLGARFVTGGGRYGILAPLENIASPLVQLLTDQTARERWAAAARRRSAEFDMSRVADQYEDLYRASPSPSRDRRQLEAKPRPRVAADPEMPAAS